MAKLAFVFRELAEAELPLVTALIPEGTIAIDAGAHYGDYTLVLAHAVGPRGQVWAVEPCARFIDVCRASVEANGLDNVRFFEAGLAGADGQAYVVGDADPSRTYLSQSASEDRGDIVELVTVDHLCTLANSDGLPVSFIKLDIEGSELSALQGAHQTIRTWRPLILVEIQEETCRRSGYSPQDLWGFIQQMGYSAFQHYGPTRVGTLAINRRDASPTTCVFPTRRCTSAF